MASPCSHLDHDGLIISFILLVADLQRLLGLADLGKAFRGLLFAIECSGLSFSVAKSFCLANYLP